MKSKILVFIIAVMMVLGTRDMANAVPYTYDFSTFASEGQSFEGATLGIMTLTSESGDLIYTNSYGGGIGTEGLGSGGGSTADVYFSFSAPINHISVRGGDGAGDNDAFSLYLYEYGTSAFLGRWDTPVFGGVNEPEWYTLSISALNIGYILFDPGNSGVLPGTLAGIGGVVITDISYDTASVPEPSTLLLLGSGLLGFWFFARKRIKG